MRVLRKCNTCSFRAFFIFDFFQFHFFQFDLSKNIFFNECPFQKFLFSLFSFIFLDNLRIFFIDISKKREILRKKVVIQQKIRSSNERPFFKFFMIFLHNNSLKNCLCLILSLMHLEIYGKSNSLDVVTCEKFSGITWVFSHSLKFQKTRHIEIINIGVFLKVSCELTEIDQFAQTKCLCWREGNHEKIQTVETWLLVIVRVANIHSLKSS